MSRVSEIANMINNATNGLRYPLSPSDALPVTDLAADSADVQRLYSAVASLDRALADALPPVTADDVRHDWEIASAAVKYRDTYTFADVTDLAGTGDDDTDGDTWTILRGSTRFEVREVPRYEARPSTVAGSPFWFVYDHDTESEADENEEAILSAGLDPEAGGYGEGGAKALALAMNVGDGYTDRYLVWDTDNDEPADTGKYSTLRECGHDDYDREDEGSANDAAEAANIEDYRRNACGWPFAHNYAAEISEYQADDFVACGFVVARHEPSGNVYAGIDGGGYSFIDAHWVPLYLRRHAGDYVPTEKGLRRLVKAGRFVAAP